MDATPAASDAAGGPVDPPPGFFDTHLAPYLRSRRGRVSSLVRAAALLLAFVAGMGAHYAWTRDASPGDRGTDPVAARATDAGRLYNVYRATAERRNGLSRTLITLGALRSPPR